MDSSGVGLVMGRYRLVSGKGKKLKVNNLSKRDYTIMKMSGIEKLAEINQRNEVYI
jgi:stage II sporulation protein AA (anti-sigma F factor antagonist)